MCEDFYYKLVVCLFSAFKTLPRRPCVFCGQLRADIRAHLLSSHRHEDEIKRIVKLSRRERDQAVDRLRKQGIAQYNRTIVTEGGETGRLMCERRSNGPKVMCSNCNGVYKKIRFHKHKKLCKSSGHKIVPRSIDIDGNVLSLIFQGL